MSSEPRHVEPGAELPPLVTRFTRADLVRYAGASGDFNPIHFSGHFAAKLELPGVIAHGMLTMGTAASVVTAWCVDPAKVVAYAFKFRNPVVVPDDEDGAEVNFTGTVERVNDGSATVRLSATCAGAVVGQGTAEVRIDE